jgi:hypothetical protein
MLYSQSETFKTVGQKEQYTYLQSIFNTVENFEELIEEIKTNSHFDDVIYRFSYGINSLKAKFNLVFGYFYFKCITKSRYTDDFNMFCNNLTLLAKLNVAREFFQK